MHSSSILDPLLTVFRVKKRKKRVFCSSAFRDGDDDDGGDDDDDDDKMVIIRTKFRSLALFRMIRRSQ